MTKIEKTLKITATMGAIGACTLALGFGVGMTEQIASFQLVKEFGVPTAITSTILAYADAADDVATVASIIAGLFTGGASLVAAAGMQGIKVFLKKEIKKKGQAAVAAW